ncbi:MAG: polysaccharide biosynthesis/export family protein [Phycisphaerales bacterium]
MPSNCTARTDATTKHARCTGASRTSLALLAALSTTFLAGCEVDSYFDPSRTGYFEKTPTTMPVLSRLDVIERQAYKGATISPPQSEDLVPSELKYRLAPGDNVRVEIFELITPGATEVLPVTIDQTGNIRLPEVGDVTAAGLTIEELQEEVVLKASRFIESPVVVVFLERGLGFQFTISGAVGDTGVFALQRPDFRLSEAIALARGTIDTTQRVMIIRSAALDDTLKPIYPQRQGSSGGGDAGGSTGGTVGEKPAVDVDALINELTDEKKSDKPADGAEQPKPSNPGAVSGLARTLAQDDKPAVDVDDLATPKAAAEEATASPTGWTFDAASGRWVRGVAASAGSKRGGRPSPSPTASMYATRIIEVDYQELIKGDPNLDVIIRPGDRIYVEPPETGFIYIDGEINRPGVFNLENSNGKLTLSRFVTAAGGLSPTAIPNRVDIVRVVGKDREATIRVDLAAIRNRSEPDIYIKPNDHVIIGTSFVALPLAVIRNGFRMTYGFGFLLDRNFGNDVFGPPPSDNFFD